MKNLPTPIRERFVKCIVCGVILIIIGIFIPIGFFGFSLEVLSVVPIPFLFGFGFIAYAFIFKNQISNKGWQVLTGTVTELIEPPLQLPHIYKKNRKLMGIIINTGEEYIKIPIKKYVPKNATIKIYINKDLSLLKNNEILSVSSIYGFEIIQPAKNL